MEAGGLNEVKGVTGMEAGGIWHIPKLQMGCGCGGGGGGGSGSGGGG
jgi:hypothetical protein